MKVKFAVYGLLIFALLIPSVVFAAGGFDQWGYNYGAHLFNGFYGNYSRPVTPVSEGDKLIMKWNDAWLSTTRERPASYIGSGAWLTNHMSGSYIGDDGKDHTWTYFVKIVAMPTVGYDCTQLNGYPIWGAMCVVQEINNDPYAGIHGVVFKPVDPGLGNLN